MKKIAESWWTWRQLRVGKAYLTRKTFIRSVLTYLYAPNTMTTTKLNIDGIMLFEQPFARVPYENYRKVFRAMQKNIERELGAVQTVASDLGKREKSSVHTPQDAAKSIDGMIGRVENLKRKVCEVHALDTLTSLAQAIAALRPTELCGKTDPGCHA